MTGETPDDPEDEPTETAETDAALSKITLSGAKPKTATGSVVRSDDAEEGDE